MKAPALLLFGVMACAAPAAQTPAAAPQAAADCSAQEREIGRLEAQRDALEAERDELARKNAELGAARPGERPRPDAAKIYSVDISGAAVTGPADARVTIVMGYEFACPYCARVQDTLTQLMADYKGQLRIVHMSYVVHPTTATLAARAACAAQQQGRYDDYAQELWQSGFPTVTSGGLDEAHLLGYARKLKLNGKQFKADMNGAPCTAQIDEQQRRLAAVGVTGTPAFFINGRFVSGARPIEQFKAVIDEELARYDAAIGKNGLTPDNYYQVVVVEGGLKQL